MSNQSCPHSFFADFSPSLFYRQIELTELKNSKSGRDNLDDELEAESNAHEGQVKLLLLRALH